METERIKIQEINKNIRKHGNIPIDFLKHC